MALVAKGEVELCVGTESQTTADMVVAGRQAGNDFDGVSQQPALGLIREANDLGVDVAVGTAFVGDVGIRASLAVLICVADVDVVVARALEQVGMER